MTARVLQKDQGAVIRTPEEKSAGCAQRRVVARPQAIVAMQPGF
jgi:hypothetical protein